MITKYKQKTDRPYSLHDMFVRKITFEKNKVNLLFEHGYISTTPPYPQVEGNITIEGIDPDFAFVYLMAPNGYSGNFQGEKLSLVDFLKGYKEFYFEIADELYGYRTVSYSGFLNLPNKTDLIETTISLYYEGDIIYETNEE